ncbi:bifunctional metallophosphatase/5'-nucleotidase [Methylomonas koyamae]|uniref:bifunctional metallophosphatase/5'-nucleotidase n=1 Tax=Methylomonas koyamae TaxID=702114 RepID=UPI0006D13B49|nr:bifunctional metallophosphatase/5'-nucleotidase [Methylomonas koyamae]BBL59828.1 multifunctional 2',3'-cyclic-nucleotide 2'-phosphodiesterase/5'-nucleotidase/3'-nucleotidase [Methylomonas koyamae]
MKLQTLASAIALGFSAVAAHAVTLPATTIKIVAFNDFHGQLESPGNFRNLPTDAASTIPLGGADWMAGYVADLKAQNPSTIVVSAGDIIGATPLVSALFHDEPTIETMNRLGLEFNAVGNHEFDEGKDELKRMQNGGCHPSDPNSCKGAEVGTPVPFEGAKFKFLAANVVETASGKTLFPQYAIKTVGGVRVGFIGMTLKETPTIVTPTGVAGLSFTDEAATVNALIPKLRARGVEAVVVLIHQGGTIPVTQSVATINNCDGGLADSPIKTIVNQLDDEVDLVISGHTHQAYNCQIANKAGRLISVTSANSQGRVLTDIDVTINIANGEVSAVSAENIAVVRNNPAITPNAGIKTIVDNYKALATPIANRVIGSISAAITRTATAAGESALGDVIADAQLAATNPAGFGEAVVSFMNPGGIRADLTYPGSSAGEGDGKVTYAEAFTVQPFGNTLVTLTLTGAQIHTLLEQQFTGCTAGYPVGAPASGQPFNRILQVSAGFSYEWSEKGTPCDNVDPASIKINGVTIDPAASYRVTVNNFMADGGDQYYVLTQGSNRLGGALDLDALESYFLANGSVNPGPRNRILLAPAP